MAGVYNGATAASSVANPPVPVLAGVVGRSVSAGSSGGIAANGGAMLWFYASTNGTSDVSAANFISDGFYLGMRPGDVLLGSYQSSIGSTTGNTYRLQAVSVSTAGVTFSTGQQSTV